MSVKSRVWRDRLELPRLELRLELPRLELPRLAISDANRSRASTPQFSRRASSLQTRIRTRGAAAQAASPSPPGAGSPGASPRRQWLQQPQAPTQAQSRGGVHPMSPSLSPVPPAAESPGTPGRRRFIIDSPRVLRASPPQSARNAIRPLLLYMDRSPATEARPPRLPVPPGVPLVGLTDAAAPVRPCAVRGSIQGRADSPSEPTSRFVDSILSPVFETSPAVRQALEVSPAMCAAAAINSKIKPHRDTSSFKLAHEFWHTRDDVLEDGHRLIPSAATPRPAPQSPHPPPTPQNHAPRAVVTGRYRERARPREVGRERGHGGEVAAGARDRGEAETQPLVSGEYAQLLASPPSAFLTTAKSRANSFHSNSIHSIRSERVDSCSVSAALPARQCSGSKRRGERREGDGGGRGGRRRSSGVCAERGAGEGAEGGGGGEGDKPGVGSGGGADAAYRGSDSGARDLSARDLSARDLSAREPLAAVAAGRQRQSCVQVSVPAMAQPDAPQRKGESGVGCGTENQSAREGQMLSQRERKLRVLERKREKREAKAQAAQEELMRLFYACKSLGSIVVVPSQDDDV